MSPVKSLRDESIELFRNDFLNFFTRVHWSVPLWLFIPLLLFAVFKTLQNPLLNIPAACGNLALGIMAWTLVEYLLHRFLFHFKPKHAFARRIFYLVHEIHHEYPNDSKRLVMPPIESVPVAAFLYWGLGLLLPESIFFPFGVGLIIGYLSYDMIHYSVHRLPMKGKLGNFLKQYHLRHRFQQEHRGYGVSSPLWDLLFHTFPLKSQRTQNGL